MKPAHLTALALLAACVVLTAPAFSQLPRTRDGHPDFQGVWWSVGFTTMERMPGATALVVDDVEAKRLADGAAAMIRSPAFDLRIDPNGIQSDVRTLMRVGGEWRTSTVTDPPDGKLPFTPEGLRYVAEERQRQDATDSAGPEGRPVYERCIVGIGATPLSLIPPAHNVRQIVQTPDSLVVYTEEGGDLRILGIGATHRPAGMITHTGDSVAHWEGDVLVVETTQVADRAVPFGTNNQVVRRQSRVVESFSLISADEILYHFTIEDPVVYARPWSAEFSLHRLGGAIYEFGCHEGNYSLPNILRAARVAEASGRRP